MKRALVIIGLASLLLASCKGGAVASLRATHVHGLAVDRGDSSRVYLAAHNGLFTLSGVEGYASRSDLDLTLVGKSRDDFMGFSPHPTDPNVLFSSGHPKGGGNLGYMTSRDGGKTWVKVNNGSPLGPADFHTMFVHPGNPDHIYGWYKLRVHRSLDGGKTWEVLSKQPPEVLSFAGDPSNENVVYIGTIGDLLRSTDKGESWTSIGESVKSDVVFDIDVDPTTGSLFLATRDQGILRVMKRVEGGASTEEVGRLPDGDFAEHLALDPKNPQTMYAFGKAHVLYKSVDGGKTWQKLL